MAIILLASVPLYVCATGSVPIAAVLMMEGLLSGAALFFLMAGVKEVEANLSDNSVVLLMVKTLVLRRLGRLLKT